MQSLRLKVKKEMIIVSAGDIEGINEDLILKEGEEYEVCMRGFNGWPIVYVKGKDYDMTLDIVDEFWEFWEFALMSELDFREIFNVDNVGMKHINEDIKQGFYSGYYDLACIRMLESKLDAKNLSLNEDIFSSESVIHDILRKRSGGYRYTLEDWIKDVLEECPECFVR